MDDPLSAILQRAINSAPATQEGSELLHAGTTASATAADARQADVAAARDHETDRQDAKRNYIRRAANLQAEHTAEEAKSFPLLLKLSSKTSLEELSTRNAEVVSKLAVIGRVIATIDGQIREARKKVHSAELALLISQREWADAAALEAAHRMHCAYLPILQQEPNTILDLSNTTVSQYVIAISDLDSKIQLKQNEGVN